jgi:hypothetical protein
VAWRKDLSSGKAFQKMVPCWLPLVDACLVYPHLSMPLDGEKEDPVDFVYPFAIIRS